MVALSEGKKERVEAVESQARRHARTQASHAHALSGSHTACTRNGRRGESNALVQRGVVHHSVHLLFCHSHAAVELHHSLRQPFTAKRSANTNTHTHIEGVQQSSVLSSKTYAYTHAYTHVDDGACSGWPSRQDEMKQQEGKSVRKLEGKGGERGRVRLTLPPRGAQRAPREGPRCSGSASRSESQPGSLPRRAHRCGLYRRTA